MQRRPYGDAALRMRTLLRQPSQRHRRAAVLSKKASWHEARRGGAGFLAWAVHRFEQQQTGTTADLDGNMVLLGCSTKISMGHIHIAHNSTQIFSGELAACDIQVLMVLDHLCSINANIETPNSIRFIEI